MILYHPIGQMKVWKTELVGIPNHWGGINVKVYLPDLTDLHARFFQMLIPSQVSGSINVLQLKLKSFVSLL